MNGGDTKNSVPFYFFVVLKKRNQILITVIDQHNVVLKLSGSYSNVEQTHCFLAVKNISVLLSVCSSEHAFNLTLNLKHTYNSELPNSPMSHSGTS